jgi:Asp-tRNA(Asn)/Glu-tRNA(Gln) amidotransferase A subunit family amidase
VETVFTRRFQPRVLEKAHVLENASAVRVSATPPRPFQLRLQRQFQRQLQNVKRLNNATTQTLAPTISVSKVNVNTLQQKVRAMVWTDAAEVAF